MTFARPNDYVSYQIKGNAVLRKAEPQEVDRSARYLVEIVSTLMRLGTDAPASSTGWSMSCGCAISMFSGC